MMGGHRHMLVKSEPASNTGNSLLTATEAFKSPRPLLGDHKRSNDVPDTVQHEDSSLVAPSIDKAILPLYSGHRPYRGWQRLQRVTVASPTVAAFWGGTGWEKSHLDFSPERSSLSRHVSSYFQLNRRFERSTTTSISTSFLPETAKFRFIERGFLGSGTAVRRLFGMDERVPLE